jgi:O-acetyl-ADP-ribose deacetylase (regulator of RNase III)
MRPSPLTIRFLAHDDYAYEVVRSEVSKVTFDPEFAERFTIQIYSGELDRSMVTSVDAVACPGNTFGVMSGGLDLAIADLLPGLSEGVAKSVRLTAVGELNIGDCRVIPPVVWANEESVEFGVCLPIVIYAPTMRYPGPLPQPNDTAYAAMTAVLNAIWDYNYPTRPLRYRATGKDITSVLIPLFGAGTGMVPVRTAIRQQLLALTNTVKKPIVRDVHEYAKARNDEIAATWRI